jgi:hypothetical protein
LVARYREQKSSHDQKVQTGHWNCVGAI